VRIDESMNSKYKALNRLQNAQSYRKRIKKKWSWKQKRWKISDISSSTAKLILVT